MCNSNNLLMCILYMLLLTTGCRDTKIATDPTNDEQSYYPFRTGNWWMYKDVSNRADNLKILRIIGSSKTGNDVYFYTVDSAFINSKFEYAFYDTLLVLGNKVIKKRSNTWVNFDASSRDSNDFHGYIAGRRDSMSVPAGIFRDVVAIIYPAANYDAMPYEYYAKGIGLIRSSGFMIRLANDTSRNQWKKVWFLTKNTYSLIKDDLQRITIIAPQISRIFAV